jgi:hypothetical protein
MKRSGVFLFILITSQLAFSQNGFREGFYLSPGNDTVRGLIDYRESLNSYKFCDFKGSQVENNIRFDAGQINGYGFDDDKFFESRIIDSAGNNVFLQVLVRGVVSLFVYEKTFYVEKGNSGLIALTNEKKEVEFEGRRVLRETNRFKLSLNMLMADCENLSESIQRLFLNERMLVGIVKEYNKCRGYVPIEYKKNKAWTRIEAGISGGIIHTSASYENMVPKPVYLEKKFLSTYPAGGLLFIFSSPRISERFSLGTEIIYFKSTSSTFNINHYSSAIEYYDTYIDASTIFVPVYARFSTSEKKNLFFAQAGISFDLYLDSKVLLIKEVDYLNVVNTYRSVPFEMRKHATGVIGGVGYQRSFSSFNGSIMLRYNSFTALDKTRDIMFLGSRIFVSLAIVKK